MCVYRILDGNTLLPIISPCLFSIMDCDGSLWIAHNTICSITLYTKDRDDDGAPLYTFVLVGGWDGVRERMLASDRFKYLCDIISNDKIYNFGLKGFVKHSWRSYGDADIFEYPLINYSSYLCAQFVSNHFLELNS